MQKQHVWLKQFVNIQTNLVQKYPNNVFIFLYYALNEALQKQDYRKNETFGPLCYLIRNYSCLEQDFIGIVCRGLQLGYMNIEVCKQM
ncbi:unnamed protein product [Adineta steineri]|uniref:Uncharacterized protein n=1 Tax=Adineta steineri TaxID=433720 RepID=A0A814DND9_9BILA|nr:unnamed protein product [Adineta steineri]CAF0979810.1 unnamed protein product [Adineta steineri]CAF1006268.1 unnamed protein product [Adineta steineri]CAF1438540.1 unnamed protein product [Adineta steineri]